MKKTIILIITILASTMSIAQIVEHYPNSNRYLYLPFFPENIPCELQSMWWVWGYPDYYNSWGHVYYASQSCPVTVYGVALPIFDYSNNNASGFVSPFEQRWDLFYNYIDTSDFYVSIYGKNERTNTPFDTIAKAHIKIGEAALFGNYFHMPDTGNCPEITMPVIEVYFSNPYTLTDSFAITTQGWRYHIYSTGSPTPIPINLLLGVYTRRAFNTNSIHLQWTGNGVGDYVISRDDHQNWGGPFAIITPPPCTAPIDLHVASQNDTGVVLEWTAPVGSAYGELEYGPEGFGAGTGTTISPVYPNAQHVCSVSIDTLDPTGSYTARVRSWCNNSGGGYSDWAMLDFTTERFFTLELRVNDDDLATAYGSGVYCDGCHAQIRAMPKQPYCYFNGWSDGVMMNARTITMTQDSILTAFYSFDSTMAIPTVAPLTFTLSPNPTGSLLYITTANDDSYTAEIFDDRGRKVADYKFHTSKYEIDVSTLPDGHYTLRFTSGKRVGTKGFVKQH